jgi:putative ABC transport system substrate-binding protein
MKRRTICRILAIMPMALPMAAAGQSPPALRVAWVSPERAGSSSPNLAAFRAGMRELGYVEGKNLVIDTWWGEGSSERLEKMAGNIVGAGTQTDCDHRHRRPCG